MSIEVEGKWGNEVSEDWGEGDKVGNELLEDKGGGEEQGKGGDEEQVMRGGDSTFSLHRDRVWRMLVAARTAQEDAVRRVRVLSLSLSLSFSLSLPFSLCECACVFC
jgi:hypothetical protein